MCGCCVLRAGRACCRSLWITMRRLRVGARGVAGRWWCGGGIARRGWSLCVCWRTSRSRFGWGTWSRLCPVRVWDGTRRRIGTGCARSPTRCRGCSRRRRGRRNEEVARGERDEHGRVGTARRRILADTRRRAALTTTQEEAGEMTSVVGRAEPGERRDWRSEGACLVVDPELFFPAAEAGPARIGPRQRRRRCALGAPCARGAWPGRSMRCRSGSQVD